MEVRNKYIVYICYWGTLMLGHSNENIEYTIRCNYEILKVSHKL